MRRVFEDAVDRWFAENGYGIRLDRERSDREHMDFPEFRATHQRAYEQGVAAAEAEAKSAKQEAAQAVAERDRAKRVHDLYAGESYQTKDGRTALGTKGLIAENKRLRAENERLEQANAAKRAEGGRIDAANAARSAVLDERDRALKAGEDRLAGDRAKLDADRAEVSRLLDGYDRAATVEDYLPPHDPSKGGERVIAERKAQVAFGEAVRANGGKPPTIHEPSLREKVKAAEEARAGYERERDALRKFREGMDQLLMCLYEPLRGAVGNLR